MTEPMAFDAEGTLLEPGVRLTDLEAATLVALVNEGSRAAAAQALGISVNTIHHRVPTILARLHARSSTHAAALAFPFLNDRYIVTHSRDLNRDVCGFVGVCTRHPEHRGQHGGFRAIGRFALSESKEATP